MDTLEREIKSYHIALASALKRRSSITGFIHLYEGKDHLDAIPVFANFSYALSLFKARDKEKIEEGKKILKKLLSFQTGEGSFPNYLHQYPICYDRYMSLKVLLVLSQIYRDFSPVIDQKEEFEQVIQRLFSHAKRYIDSAPYLEQVKFKILSAFMDQDKFDTKELIEKSENFSSKEWGEALLFLSLISEQDPFTCLAYSLFHPNYGYIGPLNGSFFDGIDPKMTLFDLAFKDPKELILKDDPEMIFAALFRKKFVFDGKSPSNLNNWKVFADPSNALTYKAISEQVEKEEEILRFHFPRHSLTFFSKEAVEIQQEENKVSITIDLEESTPDERISLYFTYSDEVSFLVEGEKSSTFQMGEKLEIRTNDSLIKVQFSKINGEGDFFGHFRRGNRPNQLDKDLFSAYDYLLDLRTVRRSKAKLKITFDLQMNR